MPRAKFTLYGVGMPLPVPVKIKKISKALEVGLKELHQVDGCGHKLGRKTWCPQCDKEVTGDEKGKGVLFNDKEKYPIQFSKDELEACKPTDVIDAHIQILNYIDPLPLAWYMGSHHIMEVQEARNPQLASAFNMLLLGLQRTGKVALVKYWDSNTVYNAVLNSQGIMSRIFWGDEVIIPETVELPKLDAKVVSVSEKVIKMNSKPFDPATALVNTYRQRVQEKALEKQNTGQITVDTDAVATPQVDLTVNLLDMYKKMLEDAEQAVKPAKKVAKGKKKKVA